jgi:hypothetical protein
MRGFGSSIKGPDPNAHHQADPQEDRRESGQEPSADSKIAEVHGWTTFRATKEQPPPSLGPACKTGRRRAARALNAWTSAAFVVAEGVQRRLVAQYPASGLDIGPS